jgi:pSer/pThr/pTyr-binding forkhead associated (FHA) protein
VTIGRSKECAISFKESNLSRIQCRIDCIDDKWFLMDGDGGKLSTNGTWIFAGEEEKIQDGTIFKAGQSLFKASLSNPTTVIQ